MNPASARGSRHSTTAGATLSDPLLLSSCFALALPGAYPRGRSVYRTECLVLLCLASRNRVRPPGSWTVATMHVGHIESFPRAYHMEPHQPPQSLRGSCSCAGVRSNPRLRAGGDLPEFRNIHLPVVSFNPRLRAGGDMLCHGIDVYSRMFQPTPPRGRRLEFRGSRLPAMVVSTHASAREATDILVRLARTYAVSTHASAREATVSSPWDKACDLVSTHASAREATEPSRARLRRHDVSTHASAREATAHEAFQRRERLVSTHASAREATARPGPWRSTSRCFNPRLRAGGDGRCGCSQDRDHGFNPRLRAGGDDAYPGLVIALDVSTHASAREATRATRRTRLRGLSGFNPRLRAGGDVALRLARGAHHVSTHASAREATPRLYLSTSTSRSFNPRLRAGGDPTRRRGCGREDCFNPRLRAGGDLP